MLSQDKYAASDGVPQDADPLCFGTSYRPRVIAAGRVLRSFRGEVIQMLPVHRSAGILPTIHWRLILIAEGTAALPELGLRFSEGMAGLLHPGCRGTIRISPRTVVLHLLFDAVPRAAEWSGLHPISSDRDIQPDSMQTWGVELPWILAHPQAVELHTLIQRLRLEVGTSAAANLLADARLGMYLANLVSIAGRDRGPSDGLRKDADESRMRTIIDIARRMVECNGGTTVAEVARQAGVSFRHLSRAFKLAGMPAPRAWLERLRIQRAAVELDALDEPVQDIARRVGYRSAAAFSRTFKRIMGSTPQGWRRRP